MSALVFTIQLSGMPRSHQAGTRLATGGMGRRAFTFKNAGLRAYQDEIAYKAKIEAHARGWQPIKKEYRMELLFTLPSKKHGDWTNIAKATEDALEKILFTNDRNCKDAHVRIAYEEGICELFISVEEL